MNDLKPLLAAPVPYVKIANNSPGKRERNHTIADCVTHYFLSPQT